MTRKISKKLIEAGYPADPLHFDLQMKLSELAGEWGGSKNDKYVRQYHAVLKCLIALGWEGDLDADAELPEELMPQEYWDYLKRKYSVKETAGD